ncbi:hypothetical protein CRG98_028032 [Punica granatum]|uniref:Uncharacterized protein n=1 Tax=Punica granatum TaxID=22663 RepID=A0A2I0J6N6_PUNGR|nr:hypothetical protein CRG98_028032 [Punica granatum]
MGTLGHTHSRVAIVVNVPNPEQARNSEIKLGKNQVDPVKEKWVEQWLCAVDQPSDRDHLFTGEGEGCEEPFELDGTTRQSRGKKRHVVEAREFGDFWLESGRVVTRIPGGFPVVSAGFGLGKGRTSWRGGLEFERILERD